MRPLARLYLTFECADDAGAADAVLQAALSSATLDCVLLCAPRGSALDPPTAKALVAVAQGQGVAALIADDAKLARMVKADGLHVGWSKTPLEAYRAAREELGGHAMIGVDAGRSRHDAMELGEAGADYVGFGIPAHVADRETAIGRQLELVSWWSEIFEVPVVAFDVESTAQATALAQAGADFITVAASSSMAADAAAAQVRAAADALFKTEATA